MITVKQENFVLQYDLFPTIAGQKISLNLSKSRMESLLFQTQTCHLHSSPCHCAPLYAQLLLGNEILFSLLIYPFSVCQVTEEGS